MEAARAVLVLRPSDLLNGQVVVFDTGALDGVCKLVVEGETAHLDKLFVDPGAMGAGGGRALMLWAMAEARRAGATVMQIEADPDAAPFYERMGALVIGTVPSDEIPGRSLPLLQCTLSDLEPRDETPI